MLNDRLNISHSYYDAGREMDGEIRGGDGVPGGEP